MLRCSIRSAAQRLDGDRQDRAYSGHGGKRGGFLTHAPNLLVRDCVALENSVVKWSFYG